MQEALPSLLFLAVLIGIFYLMLIRPQRKRVEQHRRLVESIRLGDEVVTIGGIRGVVRRLGDEEFEIEIARGTQVRFMKNAIARRLTEDVGSEPTPGAEAPGS